MVPGESVSLKIARAGPVKALKAAHDNSFSLLVEGKEKQAIHLPGIRAQHYTLDVEHARQAMVDEQQ